MVQTAEERRRRLAERIGFAMTAFAMIETQLDFLFLGECPPASQQYRANASVREELLDHARSH